MAFGFFIFFCAAFICPCAQKFFRRMFAEVGDAGCYLIFAAFYIFRVRHGLCFKEPVNIAHLLLCSVLPYTA